MISIAGLAGHGLRAWPPLNRSQLSQTLQFSMIPNPKFLFAKYLIRCLRKVTQKFDNVFALGRHVISSAVSHNQSPLGQILL
jgi:hypothetical protein